MVEKIKTDVDRLLLVSTIKTYFPIYFAKTELFNFETRSTLSTSLFILSTISQILNRTFYVSHGFKGKSWLRFLTYCDSFRSFPLNCKLIIFSNSNENINFFTFHITMGSLLLRKFKNFY